MDFATFMGNIMNLWVTYELFEMNKLLSNSLNNEFIKLIKL